MSTKNNDTIALMKNHRSIRKFLDKPVEREILEDIVATGQMASSSSNMQAYSVIAVTDKKRQAELAVLCNNQGYVEECSAFLVWCADLRRLKGTVDKHDPDAESYEGSTEYFIIATVDTALAAQNAAIAAESEGLGIVYIGSIRNRINEVAELLNLPDLVYPLFGMCIGYPDQEPSLRPRLPLPAVLHWNEYDEDQVSEPMEQYDETMTQYLRERTGGTNDTPWSKMMAKSLTNPARMHMREFLQKRGFNLK